jgi:hypothetical protein
LFQALKEKGDLVRVVMGGGGGACANFTYFVLLR